MRAFSCCLVLLALVPCAQAQPSVFIVGDSQTAGLGPILERDLRAEGVPVSGYESRHGWSTLRYEERGGVRSLLQSHGDPPIVVVQLGGNDFVRSPDQYYAQLATLVREARAAGAREIVWLGPATSDPSRGSNAASTERRHERNAELQRELLPSLGVPWIDSRPVTHDGHRPDGVHFTRAGYTEWASGVIAQLVHDMSDHKSASH